MSADQRFSDRRPLGGSLTAKFVMDEPVTEQEEAGLHMFTSSLLPL